jgi:hypothetical protein
LTQIPFVKNIPKELELLSRQQDEKNQSIIKTFNQNGNNDDVRL